jgi:predicted PurR-regulated permease PerM
MAPRRTLDAGSDRSGRVETAPPWLQVSAGWSWRLLVLAAAVGLIFVSATRIQMVLIAVFIGLVLTAVLRPVADTIAKVMPRPLATTLALLGALAVVAGLFTYIGVSVAGQWERLSKQFASGIGEIADWIGRSNLPIDSSKLTAQNALQQGQDWVNQHSGQIAGTVFQGFGSVIEVFTTIALAIFLSVFFITSGRNMWVWFLNDLPIRMRPTWRTAGSAAWDTFSGYTRGVFMIAATNGTLASIGLALLKVPLAAPLGVLVFMATFIPLIGAPLAMVVAMVVALAANGVGTAVTVGLMIAGIGQLEGHVLQPLVMGRQVSLHPVAVALSVTVGTLLAGILGAVVAVPLVSVVWSVFSHLRRADPPTESVSGVGLRSSLTDLADTSSAEVP